MYSTELQTLLDKLTACKDAKLWCEGKSLQEAWGRCENPEWMLCFVVKVGIEPKLIVQCTYEFAMFVSHPNTDERVTDYLTTVKRWLDGENISREELKVAYATALYAAADAVYDYAAAYADVAAVLLMRAEAGLSLLLPVAARAYNTYTTGIAVAEGKQADIIRKIIPYEMLLECEIVKQHYSTH